MAEPTWGDSAERYERKFVDVAKELGIDELVSPVVHLIENERVLDLGCATGWQARHLAARGCTVVGVEVDRDAAARASAWCERVIVCDLDISDLPGLVGSDDFDVVAAGDVLEHLRDPVRVLSSLRGILRPTGRVVASIPNVAHGSVRLALLTGVFRYEEAGLLDRTHLRFFTLSSVEEMFAAAGYRVEQLERIEVPIDRGTPYDRTLLPPGIETAVAAMPDATTFGFLVVARPIESAARSTFEAEPVIDTDDRDAFIRAQAEALRTRDGELVELRQIVADLERQVQSRRTSRFLGIVKQGQNRLADWLRE